MVLQVNERPLPSSYGAAVESARREVDPPSLRVRQPLTPFPELDCVRHLLPVGVIAEAERRAREIGVGADRALVLAGAISEHDYVAALARYLGIPFETLDNVVREDCALNDEYLLKAPSHGSLLLHRDDSVSPTLLIVPRKLRARQLSTRARNDDLPPRIGLTTDKALQRFVDHHGREAIARRASHALRDADPQLSAAHPNWRLRILLGMTAGLAALGFWIAPAYTYLFGAAFFSLLFIAWTALRLFASMKSPPVERRTTPHPQDLPEYTIVVALHREAAMVAQLVTGLNAFRYPREKIDIKLVVEPDDVETRNAIAQLPLDARYQIVVAPPTLPRTKPKALNAALPFARGEFIAVYDAEDRPDPDQLLCAVECFARGSNRLACVQGRLTIDNTSDSWLTKLFTAEYCGLFDVFLPALSAWRLPLPLGGSSNHFRTAVLHEAGGWDPYNVTEDADLGMRLARLGYETAVIASTTYEEAPARLKPWIHQRSRWFKGWFQTWAVHMRSPLTLYRQLGLGGFAAFQLVVGGTALAALVHPLFILAMVRDILVAQPANLQDPFFQDVLSALHSTTCLAGYAASVILAFIGLSRRSLLKHAPILLLVPLLWCLLSYAAWRGLIQLLRDPHRWEKTEHGLARTSRQAEENCAS